MTTPDNAIIQECTEVLKNFLKSAECVQVTLLTLQAELNVDFFASLCSNKSASLDSRKVMIL